MQHRQAQGRSGPERAERGPERAGKPAETGGGAAGVEPQLIELRTRVGGLETVSRRAEDRWEKWRTDQVAMKTEVAGVKVEMAGMKVEMAELRKEQAELRKEQVELRKEQTELRKEMVVGFQRADDKMDAGFQQVRSKFDAMGREMTVCFRRVDERLEEAKKATEELAQKFIRRAEVLAGLILAAILGTGIFG